MPWNETCVMDRRESFISERFGFPSLFGAAGAAVRAIISVSIAGRKNVSRAKFFAYPVALGIDYPDRELNRLTSAFRVILLVPIGIVLILVSGPGWDPHAWRFPFMAGGVLFLPPLLMILFRRKYPRWWFDWNLSLSGFGLRVAAYFALLTDVYPSTDEEQTVHLELRYPEVQKELKAGLPLVE